MFLEPKVEEDSIPEQFGKLENKVGELVERCQALQRGKADLEAKITDLEEVVRSKDAAEKQHAEEKMKIRSRIDQLLSRLDQVVDSDQTSGKTDTFGA